MAIWDAIKELEGLQRKAAQGKDIEDKDTFVVRAALKEKGWEGLVCEEAISRGYKEHRGEELGIPSWYVADHVMPTSPEVQGSETPEEEREAPGRVFNLLGDMGGEESEEEEEIHKEEFEDTVAMPAPQTPADHVAYLNSIHMLKTGNPEWEDYLWVYMKKYKLLPTDMEGLVGPRPWLMDPLWYDPDEEEIPEPREESIDDYNKRMFDEHFGDIKKEEAMETMTSKDVLMEKAKAHLADTRKRVVVGDDVGWLCGDCNSVWSLEQQICPNRCKSAEPPTVENRGWPKEESPLPLEANVRFPEEEAGDPLAADPAWLRKHMADHLEMENKSLEEKKEDMEARVKDALGVETLPGDPEPCPLCQAYDNDQCGCCLTCEETDGHCKCCGTCNDYPCICDTTEECPICEGRIVIGEACPTGCDADMIELAKLYDDVKNDKSLKFEEKVRYMSLLKEKMGFAANEEVEEQMPEPETFDEDE